MTKLSLKLGSPEPEDGFSYPNRSHIMSRTKFKEIDFFLFFQNLPFFGGAFDCHRKTPKMAIMRCDVFFFTFFEATYDSAPSRFFFLSCDSNCFGGPNQPPCIAITPLLWEPYWKFFFNTKTCLCWHWLLSLVGSSYSKQVEPICHEPFWGKSCCLTQVKQQRRILRVKKTLNFWGNIKKLRLSLLPLLGWEISWIRLPPPLFNDSFLPKVADSLLQSKHEYESLEVFNMHSWQEVCCNRG